MVVVVVVVLCWCCCGNFYRASESRISREKKSGAPEADRGQPHAGMYYGCTRIHALHAWSMYKTTNMPKQQVTGHEAHVFRVRLSPLFDGVGHAHPQAVSLLVFAIAVDPRVLNTGKI